MQSVLGETLASLRAQTFKAWHAYCVDDGSRDGGGEVLDEAARQDARLTVIYQRNAGPGEARNRALGRVSAPYFYFFDVDDLLHPQAFEVMIAFAGRYAADVVLFQYKSFRSGAPLQFPTLSEGEIAHRVIEHPGNTVLAIGAPCRHLFKTSVYGGLRFMAQVYYEDVPYLHEVGTLQAARIVVLDVVLYYYRAFEDSIMHQPLRLKHMENYARILRATVCHCLDKGRPEALKLLCDEGLPYILKSQLGAVRRAPKEEQGAMGALFAEELRFLFARRLIPFRKHKLRRYLKYRLLAAR